MRSLPRHCGVLRTAARSATAAGSLPREPGSFFFERDNQPKKREGAREREKERRVERGAPLEVIEEREERRGGVFGCCACPVRGFSLALVLKNTDERVAERGSGGA